MKILPIFSWAVVLWTAKVFLFSLPYKFTLHPDTQHIFGVIGAWMQGFLGETIGTGFSPLVVSLHFLALEVGALDVD